MDHKENSQISGEELMDITSDQLKEGITFEDGKDGLVATVEATIIPSNKDDFNTAVELAFAKLDASIDRIKKLPKLSSITSLK